MTKNKFGLFLFPWLICAQLYSWNPKYTEPISSIKKPKGFVEVGTSKFGTWIRSLPLLPQGSPVLLYSGKEKPNQTLHTAVLDIDVGKTNLQQCADAVIRLRAEYLYATKRYSDIQFNFTSGHTFSFVDWLKGHTPVVQGNHVSFPLRNKRKNVYSSFKRYLTYMFMYAGTYSLKKELEPVKNIYSIRIGDVFIQGGFPGHAMMVVDVVEKGAEKQFLLAQSYMPAQSIHIVKNPNASGPWYTLSDTILTPEWKFTSSDLYRFK